MQFQDQQLPPPPTSRGPAHHAAWVAAIAIALLVVVAVAAVLVTRGDGQAAGSPSPTPSSPQPTASPTTTTIDPQTEVVARLREILRVRDQALLKRNANLLDDIYTVDCNCLQDGRTAIRRLRQERIFWKGLSTRLTVQQIERVNDRLWVITGVLSTAAVRIENELGALVRLIPPERNRLRFALAKPLDVNAWLLGHVSLLNEGG
jgi:hypothetical protein